MTGFHSERRRSGIRQRPQPQKSVGLARRW